MEIAAVVGLGNPGPEYAATRHNLGFWVVDELARRWRVARWHNAHHARVARRSGGQATWLVKPQDYMNCSGGPVAAFLHAEGLAPSQVLVVVDDVELPLGQLRLRSNGGPGTHNGLRSLVEEVGEGFPRLRVGIQGNAGWGDLADYVLAPFDRDEEPVIREAVSSAADCIEMAIRAGLGRAATRYNRVPPAEPGSAPTVEGPG
jgi:peptidyl-tRNA hydrolase, PTH1 family